MAAGFCLAPFTSNAQDASWLLNPGSADFNTGSNWSPATVPTGTATFGASNTTSLSFSAATTTVNSLLFNAGASAFTLNVGAQTLTLDNGITNNSSVTQTLTTSSGGSLLFNGGTAANAIIGVGAGTVTFNNSSTGGSATFTVGSGGNLNFFDTSNGSTATITNNAGTVTFDDNSTAGNAIVTNNNGGTLCFCNDASAGNATITNATGATVNFFLSSTAGTASITNSGTVEFQDTSTAGSATITTLGGGLTKFTGTASGGSARLITQSGGNVDFSGLTAGTTVGSIEGAGNYQLGANALTVGSNNLSTTVSGVISGSGGSLVKTGSGTLTLSGANTYSGGTTVNGGGLVVNGSLASGVTVGSAGLLGGGGTINGNVTSTGTLAPGGVGNTLTINGNLTQSGPYRVTLIPGQSALTSVSGTASVAGAVTVSASSGVYSRNQPYTILSSTGARSGAFSGVSSNFTFLTPSLSYDAHNVFLTLTLGPNAFASAAITPNQAAVGAVLDRTAGNATGDFSTVINAIASLNLTQGLAALDAISGQAYSGFASANLAAGQQSMNVISQQLADLHGRTGGGGRASAGSGRIGLAQACDIASGACEVGSAPRWGAWVSGVGGAGTVDGSNGAGTLTYNFAGPAVGVDYRFTSDFVAGLSLGYSNGTQWVSGLDGQATSDSYTLAFYGSATEGAAYLDGLAGYAYNDNHMLRNIVIPGLSGRTATGYAHADLFFGQVEGGYKVPIYAPAEASLTPFARLQGATNMQGAFSESGASSLDLNVAQQTTNSLRSTLGGELGGAIDAGWREKLALKLRLGWAHEYADLSRPTTASFAGAPGISFTAQGAAPQRDGITLGFGASTAIAEATSVYMRYDGDFGQGANNNVVSAGVRLTW